MNCITERKSEEGFISVAASLILLSPLIMLCVAMPIGAIESCIQKMKEKKNPTITADKLINELNDNIPFSCNYPHADDKNEKGEPYWVVYDPSLYFECISPSEFKNYLKKVDTVLTAFTTAKDTETFAKTVDSALKSSFGNEIKIDTDGTIKDNYCDTHTERVKFPNSAWYQFDSQSAKVTTAHAIDTYGMEIIAYRKSLIPKIKIVRENITRVMEEPASKDKEEMGKRLAYLRFARGILNWVRNAVNEYDWICHSLSENTPVDSTDE